MRVAMTGASSGIGSEVAARLVADGHTVIPAGRSRVQLRALRAAWIRCDLRSLRDVSSLAIQLLDETDVFLNCAGVAERREEMTAEGFLDDITVVNFLAPMVLRMYLRPTTKQFVEVTSRSQADWLSVSAQAKSSAQMVYGMSKFASYADVVDLARTSGELRAVAVNPGSLVDTPMVRNLGLRPRTERATAAERVMRAIDIVQHTSALIDMDEVLPIDCWREHRRAPSSAMREEIVQRWCGCGDIASCVVCERIIGER